MLIVLLSAGALVAVTVAMHGAGLAWLVRFLLRSHSRPPTQPGPISWLLIRVTLLLIVFHMLEITVWALFYFWRGCLPDAESAFYFAGVTYTTIGYGDLVLMKPWRMLSPIEGLVGILMCGLSTGLFFALVSKIFASYLDTKRE